MKLYQHILHSGVAIAMGCVASAALAADLTIGLSAEPTSMDPHFHVFLPNSSFRTHIFESVMDQDEQQRLKPGLATFWEPIDDTTWRFDLREGVKFTDGTDFDANDVIYSICRIPNVPNSPSSYSSYVANIASIEKDGPYALIVKTKKVDPLMPVSFSTWGVISAESNGVTGDVVFKPEGCENVGTFPTTEDFNSGKAMVGTGPYKFVSFTKGDSIVVEKNADYWGDEAAQWDKVTFRPISSDGPRVAAILSGDVDVIENPPVQDIPRLKEDPNLEVYAGLSNRVIYLFPMYGDAVPSGVEGTDGKNPFLDIRVRQAMSKAIDREAIAERVMGGMSIPAGELLPGGMFGTSFAEADKYDPDAAKALLAEAGYPNGFKLLLGTPNDRYINDERIAQTVAQYFARIGIEVSVDAVTASQFFARRNKGEFGLYLAGWGAPTGEMSSPLTALLATPNKEKGLGGTNKGKHSDPELDAVIEQAIVTVDDAEREALLRKASKMGMDNVAIIPLHFEVSAWAARKGLEVQTHARQLTTAMQVHKK